MIVSLVSFTNTQLNRSSFKQNIQSYISQVELPPYSKRTLLFDLEDDFKNCTVVVEFFPRYHFSTKDADLTLRSSIDVFGPKDEKLMSDTFKVGNKAQKPIKKKMMFKEKGSYSITMKNIEKEPIIGAIMLDMEECKAHDKHAGNDEMASLSHKVEKMVWRLFEMFGRNELTENQMQHKDSDLNKSHNRLTCLAISEIFAMMMIAG